MILYASTREREHRRESLSEVKTRAKRTLKIKQRDTKNPEIFLSANKIATVSGLRKKLENKIRWSIKMSDKALKKIWMPKGV